MPDRPCRILVVEDQPEVACALREALEGEGYEVDTVIDGRTALETMRRASRPDLVLLDLFMPEMDGWGFATRMRGDPELAPIPIVIMTAGGPSALAAAPVSDGYMTKPIALELLLDILRRILSMQHTAAGVRCSADAAAGAPLGSGATTPRSPDDETTLH